MRYVILSLALCAAMLAPALAATAALVPDGNVLVTIPASQYINVFTEGGSSAYVYKRSGFPNAPDQFELETNGEVSNKETSFGPYTLATTVKIVSGSGRVLYSVGSGGLAIPVSRIVPALSPGAGSILRATARLGTLQPVPSAKTTAVTLTAAELLTGIITGTHTAGATQAYTLPTGTLLEAAVPFLQIGEGFEWVLINLNAAAADSITVTAATDHTIVGDAIVISNHVTTGGAITSHGCSSSTWITKKTAANTFVTYRKN